MGANSLKRPALPASAQGAWPAGPLCPRLAPLAVHVWRADLTAVSDELGELINDDEHKRAGRMLRECDRRLWRRARGVLRALLGRYLQTDPAMLRFATGTHGKPALLKDPRGARTARSVPPASAPISFNLSHSGSLALLAFALRCPVGVDVQVARPATRRPTDQVSLTARALGVAAARRLEALDPRSREREFLRLWTRYEAELKCLGTGIGGPRRRSFEPWVAELDIGSGAAGALALAHPARELRRWEWL